MGSSLKLSKELLHRPPGLARVNPPKMFKNTFQSGFLSILYSIGSKPLQIWDKKVRNGHIKRITDNDIQSLVLEIEGTNVSTTYITCPADAKKTLGIKLPYLVMIIKNLKKYFTLRCRYSTTKMCAAGSELLTTNRLPAWNRLFARCQCDLMTAGIRFSSICPISLDELMVPTTSRPCAFRSTPTAESDVSTSLTACTPRTSSQPSSNCICRCRTRPRLPTRQCRPDQSVSTKNYGMSGGAGQPSQSTGRYRLMSFTRSRQSAVLIPLSFQNDSYF